MSILRESLRKIMSKTHTLKYLKNYTLYYYPTFISFYAEYCKKFFYIKKYGLFV